MYGDTGRVDLSHTGVREVGALLVALPGSRAVGGHSVRREEEGITVAARTDDDGVGCEALDLTRHEVAGDDPSGTSVDDDDVEHLVARVELDRALADLTAQGGVSAEQQLLPRLTAGIEGT